MREKLPAYWRGLLVRFPAERASSKTSRITCRGTAPLSFPPSTDNVHRQPHHDCNTHDNGDLRGQ